MRESENGEIMKKLFVVLDGGGDEKIRDLGNKTPLEKAKLSNMDEIAENGINGSVNVIREDIAPESDQALMSLLGYDPFKYYPGRGVVEALGAGLKIDENNVYVRGNFAYIEKDIIKETSVKVDFEENKQICNILNEKIGGNVEFKPTMGYRFLLILKGNFSDEISNTHPGYEFVENKVTTATEKRFNAKIIRCRALKREKNAMRTAKFLNGLTLKVKEILERENFPCNYILLRGAGSKVPELKKIDEKWIMLADSPADKGIGKLVGMQLMEKVEDNAELAEKINNLFENWNNIYVQIKSPDKKAHRRNFKGKVKILEDIDRHFFGNLNMDDLKVILTCDHCTSSIKGVHIKNPVPLAITGTGEDNVKKFDEYSCRNGKIGFITGKEVLKIAGR